MGSARKLAGDELPANGRATAFWHLLRRAHIIGFPYARSARKPKSVVESMCTLQWEGRADAIRSDLGNPEGQNLLAIGSSIIVGQALDCARVPAGILEGATIGITP